MTYPLDEMKELVEDDGNLKVTTFGSMCDLILRDLANTASFLSKPPGGSSNTLDNHSIKGDKAKVLLEMFTKKWFSANRISMTLVSKHDVGSLENMVINMFGYI